MQTVTTQAGPRLTFGVGIDTARYGHDVSFLREDRQPAAKPLVVTENQAGYQSLREQLDKLNTCHPHVHFCVRIDAAGQYATNLERYLRQLPYDMAISIGEPKRNKDYHAAMSPKRTSDRTESHSMARFAIAERPQPTPDVPDSFFALREIASRLQSQVRDTTRAINRLHNLLARVFPELATLVKTLAANYVLKLLTEYPTAEKLARANLSSLQKIPHLKDAQAKLIQEAAKKSIGSLKGPIAETLVKESVQQLKESMQAKKRLEKLIVEALEQLPSSGHRHVGSIAGIGSLTAAVLVAKIIDMRRFETPDDLVGYFGAFPQESTSGVDRHGKPIPPGTMKMCAKGSDIVRGYLWNAAKSAIQCNPAVTELYKRLRAKGTRGDVALGSCMRKLLHQVFGVWTTDRPFDIPLSQPRRLNPTPSQARDDVPPSNVPPTEMAAGHTREVPQQQVVTAAELSVAHPQPQPPVSRGSIDYAYLREQVSLEQVLTHLSLFDRLHGRAQERRGPCPFHSPDRETSQSFTVNLEKNVFHCLNPRCQAKGNALDLWCQAQKLPLYEGALQLADTFHLPLQRTERKEAARINSP